MFSYVGKNVATLCPLVFCLVFVLSISTVAGLGALRLVGGMDALETQLPYVVRLERNISLVMKKKTINLYIHSCTGSVLTPQWILTARHCIDDRKLEAITTVRINKYFIRYGAVGNSQLSDVVDFVRFKDRTKKLDDDIGLIKAAPIKLAQYGRLSSLNFYSLMYQEVTATGFGVTTYKDNEKSEETMLTDTRTQNRTLQIVKGMVINCANVYPSVCITQSCTKTAMACHGDSGGPVIHRSGIVAIHADADVHNKCRVRKNTFRSRIMSVAIPISPYLDWLTKIINKDKELKIP